MLEISFFLTALVATIAGILAFRRYAPALGMIDVPNERSSHSSPTLRGGGVVIATVCLVLYIGASLVGLGPINWSFVAGAVVVAVVSVIDDGTGLRAQIKFLAHCAAAVLLVAGSGPMGSVLVPGFGPVVFPTGAAYALTFLWVAGMITVYNFMDGIDGIAGSQAVIAGVGWAALGLWFGDPMLYIFAGVIACSGVGFLLFNWPPASLFMGDVGSAFLGYTFAAMPLLASVPGARKSPWMFTAAVSFMLLFAFDMAFTFTRRLLRSEKAWQPHREHLYQRLVLSGWSHSSVSALYAALALLVTAACLLAVTMGGSAVLLLLFLYAVLPLAMTFLTFRKNV